MPRWSASLRSPVFHFPPLMNCTTPTRQPRAQPRAITPKAADDLPLPCPVLRRTTESARVTPGEATRSPPPTVRGRAPAATVEAHGVRGIRPGRDRGRLRRGAPDPAGGVAAADAARGRGDGGRGHAGRLLRRRPAGVGHRSRPGRGRRHLDHGPVAHHHGGGAGGAGSAGHRARHLRRAGRRAERFLVGRAHAEGRRADRPREQGPHPPFRVPPRPAGGQRLLRPGGRPAVPQGRHRRLPRPGPGHRRPHRHPDGRPRGRPAGRRRRAPRAGQRPQGRRHGVLLRRRDGVVAAGRRRGPAGGRLRRSTARCPRHPTSRRPRPPYWPSTARPTAPGSTTGSSRPSPPWRPPSCTHEVKVEPGAGHAFFNDTGTGSTPPPRPTPTPCSSAGSAATSHDRRQ